MPLYHYTKLSTLLEYILPSKSLKTNNLNEMNDPRESEDWAFGGINIPLETLFPESYSSETFIDCQLKFGQMIKDRFQVICFSGAKAKGWDNEMMWAHYADRQRGVCLEFDERALMESLTEKYPEYNSCLEAVNYLRGSKERPDIYWDRKLDDNSNFKNNLLRIYPTLIFHKSHFWKKEDEKRLLIINNENLYVPIETSLKAIHLGIGCHYSYTSAVGQMIKGTQIKLYAMIYQDDKYDRWRLRKGSERWETYVDD